MTKKAGPSDGKKKIWRLPPFALRLLPAAKRSLAGPSKLFLPASRPVSSWNFLSNSRKRYLTKNRFSVKIIKLDGTPQKGGENNGNNFS